MTFPSDKPHRRNRRKLSRGKVPQIGPTTITVTGTGNTAIVAFTSPVFSVGKIPLRVSGLSIISQNADTPTQITVTMSGAVDGHTYAIDSNTPQLRSPTGAPILGTSGTFGAPMPIAANDVLIADGSGGMIGGRGSIDSGGNLAVLAGGSLAVNGTTIDATGNIQLATGATLNAGGTIITASGQINMPGGQTLNVPGTINLGSGAWTMDATSLRSNNGIVFAHDGFFQGEIAWVDYTYYQSSFGLAGYVVSSLPAGTEGDFCYATNGCKVGEGSGSGTGVPVYFSQGAWRVLATDQPVTS